MRRELECNGLIATVIIALAWRTRYRFYVRLMDEGTECSRPTQALDLENGLFKVLPTSNYDPRDEVWEFPPDSMVRSEISGSEGKEFLIAVARWWI